MAARHPELDLERSLRPGLDILANEILTALKKRTRFPHNPEIYQPGLVREDRSVSLLRYELGKIERAHAELGRYTYASQESFTDVTGIVPVIDRHPPQNPVAQMPSGVGDALIEFYLGWIEKGCSPGSDSNTYGETVTADVSALLGILERVNLGKYVAESKLSEDPTSLRAAGGDPGRIRALLVRKEREAEVLELARELAEHYDFDAGQAVEIFAWMVASTVDIEVAYVRMRLGFGD